jgi:hypothetical protein
VKWIELVTVLTNLCHFKFLIYVSVSLSLEMMKILFSFNFYNFGYSACSGNRNIVRGFVVLYLIFIVVYDKL